MGGVEVPHAPRGEGGGMEYPLPNEEGSGEGAAAHPENLSYFLLKIPHFDAF